MKWSYDLTGAELIIKDEPIYDAALIDDGELVMLGASAFSAAADAGIAFISAYGSTVMSANGLTAVGICLERKTTASSPSVATAHNTTSGAVCYGKVIINPCAVYRAQVTESLDVATSTGTAEFAVTGIPASAFDGQWVYFSNSAGANYGQLRKVVTSATGGTQVVDAATLSTSTSSDDVRFISEKHKSPNILNVTATGIGATSVGASGANKFRVVENYIDRGNGFEILQQKTHGSGKVNLGSVQAKITKFYQDIVLTDHIYGA